MTETLHIRRSGAGDLPALDALFGVSYPALLKNDYLPSVLVTAIPLISRAQPALVTSGTFFVAVDDTGMIRGAGGWTRGRPGGAAEARSNTGHIRHVVTDHRSVRKGIGRALMTRILDDARSAGLARMECLSTLTAVPFYAACGFDEQGPVTVPLRPGIDFPAILMQRSL